MNFLSEQAIREQVTVAAQRKATALQRAPDPDVVQRWIQQCVTTHKRNQALVTHQQYLDLRARRTLGVGDTAVYVAPTRTEPTNEGEYERPTGQLGTVTKIVETREGTVITWRPHATDRIVELVVRTNTPGYFTLERIVS
jgi:hypothetical protein